MNGLPIINLWHKIVTPNKDHFQLVDWNSLKWYTTSTTNQHWRWETYITAQELPTRKTMKLRGRWTTSDWRRGCGHTSEEILHTLKCSNRSRLWEKSKNNWEMGSPQQMNPPPSLNHTKRNRQLEERPRKKHTHLPPEPSNAYCTQSRIGWIQDLMGIIYHTWAELQRPHLQYISAKVTVQIWISSLIKKLWYTAWEIWNKQKHILHN